MVFLPECFDYVGRTREENISLAVDEEGEYIGRYRQLAKTSGLWISLGGFHHKVPQFFFSFPHYLLFRLI